MTWWSILASFRTIYMSVFSRMTIPSPKIFDAQIISYQANKTQNTCMYCNANFSAATKQLYEWFRSVCLSVCPSVRPSHLFDYVPIIVSSWSFQELLPMTQVTSMQKDEVRGQRSRSQRSKPNVTVSGLYLQFEFTYDDEMMHTAWCCLEEVPYCFWRSSVKFQGHKALKSIEFDTDWVFPDCSSSLNSPMATKWYTKLEVA